MYKAKSILTISLALIICTIGFSQALFIDSGQRLGNAASWSVKLGDLDGDGDLDAVLGNNFWNNVIPQHNKIWLNNGDATFVESQQQLDASNTITLADVDNDGDLDIIENGDWSNGIIKTWLNDGHANFSLSNNFPFRGNLIIFDNKFSSHNPNDVITFETGDSTILRIYSIDNDTAVIKKIITIKDFRAVAMATGDLNNDGYSDIVIGQDSGPTFILLNNKQGGFITSDQKLGNNVCSNLYLGDLNGDGFLDLLQCNYHTETGIVQPAQLYLNDGTGRFTIAPMAYNTSLLTQSAALKDLDNDGDLDIYLNHGHRYQDWDRPSEILFNDGHANFTVATVNLDLIQSDAIAFGDLDNDGDLDAFLAVTKIIDDNHYGGASRVWLNTTITNPTGINKKKKEIPNDYNLFQNYPNPFNPTTIIQYSCNQSSQIKLNVYNLLGQKIITLIDSYQNTGEHSIVWNGTDDSNREVSSGVYFYRLETNGSSIQRKMLLLR